ncbi:hypothetical protein B0H66DRAFT_157104 [Apodospora peruviana]|uniref:Uncharacterized protein n=1 Tax=Apodospora peruviana TaxID=516989 RepID=A0AAE0IJL6_9PEZI|nr:hypothetical protein B0H66DRAFT_157104 [Apodospora peruviana]
MPTSSIENGTICSALRYGFHLRSHPDGILLLYHPTSSGSDFRYCLLDSRVPVDRCNDGRTNVAVQHQSPVDLSIFSNLTLVQGTFYCRCFYLMTESFSGQGAGVVIPRLTVQAAQNIHVCTRKSFGLATVTVCQDIEHRDLPISFEKKDGNKGDHMWPIGMLILLEVDNSNLKPQVSLGWTVRAVGMLAGVYGNRQRFPSRVRPMAGH